MLKGLSLLMLMVLTKQTFTEEWDSPEEVDDDHWHSPQEVYSEHKLFKVVADSTEGGEEVDCTPLEGIMPTCCLAVVIAPDWLLTETCALRGHNMTIRDMTDGRIYLPKEVITKRISEDADFALVLVRTNLEGEAPVRISPWLQTMCNLVSEVPGPGLSSATFQTPAVFPPMYCDEHWSVITFRDFEICALYSHPLGREPLPGSPLICEGYLVGMLWNPTEERGQDGRYVGVLVKLINVYDLFKEVIPDIPPYLSLVRSSGTIPSSSSAFYFLLIFIHLTLFINSIF